MCHQRMTERLGLELLRLVPILVYEILRKFRGHNVASGLRTLKLKQDAQLSQRDRAAGYISFGRKWKTGTQRQYFTVIVSLA